ncbi:transmembrane protein 180 isoform X2 [Mesocricetus auratus]|uniref:Transmembrane protein 180 isoform X2 n=1 Tax=Mesocricetus auratus TaxID=10036 RepID=A0ABM2X988_MESAU|nr:transmembrane protein 180 isoform X2 [Mesocricetus auratus]
MGLDWPQAWLLGLPTAVVYGSLALFTSILHNVFLLYYVDTFVSVYKINKVSFWIGETVFLLWNSFNDPLFGWFSDRQFLSSQPRSEAGLSSRDVVLARVRALSWHGPLLALSFLAFWVPWAPAGVQFLLCLCLYDGFLTLVDLHHHALLADLALSAHGRTHLNFYCSLFSAAGSMSVFASYAFWNKEDFSSFRAFCVVLAAGSGLGFLGATRLLRQRIEVTRRERGCSDPVVDGGACEDELLVGGEEAGSISLGQYLRQLARHQNFLWFVGMDLVQVFHCHFNSNFFPLFLEHLLSDRISLSTGSFLLVGPSSLLRRLLCCSSSEQPVLPAPVPALGRLCRGAGALPAQAGAQPPHALGWPRPPWPALLLHCQGTCKLLTLVVTDLVDEDLVLNHRKQAASALLFGMVALVTKPGQTFAPLLGTWLLCFYTGHDLFQQPPMMSVGSVPPWPEPPAPAPAQAPTLRQGCFYLLVLVPVTCALLQLFTWSRFTLHGRRLRVVKAQRQNLAQTHTLDIKTV